MGVSASVPSLVPTVLRPPPEPVPLTKMPALKDGCSLLAARSKLLALESFSWVGRGGGHLLSVAIDPTQPLGCALTRTTRVARVEPESQAARCGLQLGTFIVGVGRYQTQSVDEVLAALELSRAALGLSGTGGGDQGSPAKSGELASACSSAESSRTVLLMLHCPGTIAPASAPTVDELGSALRSYYTPV